MANSQNYYVKVRVILVWSILSVFFLSLYSCITIRTVTDVNHLREAQKAFNEASALENQIQMGGLDPFAAKDTKALAANTVSIQGGYASALLSINKIYPEEKELLKDNKLLGATLALKAMALWRTGAYEEALNTADLAKKEAADQLYPRDAAVIQAMPGFIKTDLGYNRIRQMNDGEIDILNQEIRPRLVGDKGAVADIRNARKKVHKNHEINVYLINAQLAAFRNYQVAHQKARGGENPLDTDGAKMEAQYNLSDLEELVKVLKLGQKGMSLVDYWKYLCTINPKKRQ
jgi:hypothetical protein